jgi:uncharacterized iron-regulated protein
MFDRNVNMIKKAYQGKRIGGSACRHIGVCGNASAFSPTSGRQISLSRSRHASASTPTRRTADTFPLTRRHVSPAFAIAFCLCLGSCAIRSGTARIGGAAKSDEHIWEKVEKADVVYVGEKHDDPVDHRYELALVDGLLKRKKKFAIGWEMFDKTQQSTLDAWASHAISLQAVLARTDFQKHWGKYSPAYEQILQIAGNAGVPNLALNASPELPRKIARGELLTGEERAMVPAGFVASEQAYRNFVAMVGDHPGMHEADQRRFFDAQNVWDQTMASIILEFKGRNPNVLLVVLTGRGHVTDGYGIPCYVRQKSKLKQLILLPAGR